MKETIKRQRLFFISLIGIVVVSLIMGTTFAYQTIVIDKQEGASTDVSLNIGKLNVSYTKNNENINLTNMPLLNDYKSADYIELVINSNDSTDDVAYQITLKGLEYSPILASTDFKYTLTELIDGNEVHIKTGDFSSLTSTEFTLMNGSFKYLKKGNTQTIRLYLWLEETSEVQNDFEKATFKGQISIISFYKKDVQINLLSEKIINNAILAKENNDPQRTQYSTSPLTTPAEEPSGENERLLLETEDDYTATTGQNSYYFRGNVEDNYVNFAGMCWRIVRIEGDGSVKLILEDQDQLCNSKDTNGNLNMNGNWNIPVSNATGASTIGNFGYSNIDNVGYKANYLNLDNAAVNYDKSLATALKNFQTTKLVNYIEALKNEGWCNENAYPYGIKDVETTSPLTEEEKILLISSGDGYDYDSFLRYYGYYDSNFSKGSPTLKCHGTKQTKWNDNTSIFVTPLNPNEALHAGGKIFVDEDHYGNYLYNDYQKTNELGWWLSTPSSGGSVYNLFYVCGVGCIHPDGELPTQSDYNTDNSFRPSIVLTSSAMITEGNGTQENPYVILSNGHY